jgi:hypothetical protein
MRELEIITARGTGTWGSNRYDIELSRRETTWLSQAAGISQVITTWHADCGPEVGGRSFTTEAEREAFVAASFGDSIRMATLDQPEERLLTHPLTELVGGDDLAFVTFVRDYMQLGFDGPLLNLYVMPWVYGDALMRPGDSGYADEVIRQVGHTLVAVDELLDYGLVLDWDNNTRFAVPLDGTGLHGVEAAEFLTGAPRATAAIWRPGDPPLNWASPPVT